MLTALNCLLLAAALPLVAFLLLLLLGHRLGRRGSWAGGVGLIFALGSLGLSLGAMILWVASHNFEKLSYVEVLNYRWIPLAFNGTGDGISVGVMIDSLTIAMFLGLTVLSVLIHMFAWANLGEASGEKRDKSRVFTWLAFLNFALLGLPLANSLVQLFIFWEFTSLGIFFLVRTLSGNGTAGIRFYVMQAIGSAAFMLGVGILVAHTGALGELTFFDGQGSAKLVGAIAHRLGQGPAQFLHPAGGQGFMDTHWLTWVGICFLTAALARLALFPFHTWLVHLFQMPAAVVSMISVGTLAAGTLLLARVYPILTLDARFIAAIVGCVTLAMGGLIALVQTDLRRLLLWSTISQGGYILLFMGAGGYSAGVLQLVTHGFAKTALLLAAGSVVASTGTGDLRLMGGLWKRLPLTAIGGLLGVAALGGVPWMSGAYSANLGLGCVYDYAHALQDASGRRFELLLFHIPAIFTYVTALGLGRWWWLIFGGTSRDAKLFEGTHESAYLTLPIIVLAGSYAGVLYDFGGILPLIAKSIPAALEPHGAVPLVVSGSQAAFERVLVDTGWAFTGLLMAGLLHYNGFTLSAKLRRLPGVNYVDYWLRGEMFFDELFVVVAGLARGVLVMVGWLDRFGRLLVKVVSNIGPLGEAVGRRIERAKQKQNSSGEGMRE